MDEDEVFEEGCPDCGNDTVVEEQDEIYGPEMIVCTTCGWRP